MLEIQRKSKIPTGMREVPEDERIQTLKDLNEVKDEIINALERYPIVRDGVNRTSHFYKEMENLQTKLGKIEQTIKQFERPPVYISYL